ncbi:UNVERIFIED_CONTAM: hypothetical protein GTU68_044669 [Idotea baltica]|nr:hypothetical protein [Idotea baltica]
MPDWAFCCYVLGDIVKTDLLIGGRWCAGSAGERIEVVDPSTGDVIDSVAAGGAEDASAAVDAAAAAQPGWAATAPRVRAEILRNCWQTLMEHTDELADLIVKENGKPRSDAVGEVAYAAEFFRWNAEETVRIHGSIGMAPGGDKRIIVQHPPMGVVVMVTPWNFPAAMITRKLAPALGAGNAVVIKPPAETPLTALRVAELCEEAGVPAGLINVVAAQDPGAWFDAAVENKATRMVSFTGSTAVGRMLLRRLVQAAVANGATTELGGNPIAGPGFFYEPTVLGNVAHNSPIAGEEIFGPIAPVIPFTDTDQMITEANDTEMGLAAYVYTEDLRRGLQVSERLQSGMVGLNRGAMSDPAAPFGGMKQSGLGREGASEGIYEFCETQYIAANW